LDPDYSISKFGLVSERCCSIYPANTVADPDAPYLRVFDLPNYKSFTKCDSAMQCADTSGPPAPKTAGSEETYEASLSISETTKRKIGFKAVKALENTR